VARESQGHTAHQADPRKKTEIMSPAHQIFQVNTVAILRSGIGVPNSPAAITSKNNNTINIFSVANNQGLAVRNLTHELKKGIFAKLILNVSA